MKKTQLQLTKQQKSELKVALKALKQFRKDKNEFINACESLEWKSWTNTPHFWLHWSIANVASKDIKTIVDLLMNVDALKQKYFDVYWTIAAVYENPMKWVGEQHDGGEQSLKYMLQKYGQPY